MKIMNINNSLMTIFLMLLIGLSLQYKLNENEEHDTLSHSHDSEHEDSNEENQNSLDTQSDTYTSGESTTKPSGLLNLFKNKLKISSKNSRTSSTNSTTVTKTVVYKGSTTPKKSKDMNIEDLKHHKVSCSKSNSAIHSFQFNADKKKMINFSFSCVQSPAISNTCSSHKTPYTETYLKVLKTFDTFTKHFVDCPEGTVMKSFNMGTRGKFYTGIGFLLRMTEKTWPNIFFEFTCCKAEISRVLFLETGITENKTNNINNLKRQKRITAQDLNVISMFHMQIPSNKIFFQLRMAVLKGQTSPSMPNYFEDNSKNPSTATATGTTATKPKPSNTPSFVGKYFYFKLFSNINFFRT